jgi:hypothetical protein
VGTRRSLTPVIEICPVCREPRVKWRGVETVHLASSGSYSWFEGRWVCVGCGWASESGGGYTIYDAQLAAARRLHVSCG